MIPRVGLVTVLFNSANVLPGFFKSLSIQKFQDYWLYIIDNSLDDVSYNAAKDQIQEYGFINFTIIKNPKNVGVAAANNQGIKLSLEAGCKYVLLLNNDIEFNDADLLGNMFFLAEQRKEKLIVPKILFFDTDLIWCAGGSINKWRGTTPHRGYMQQDSPIYSEDCYTEYAPTCFMLIHREVFDQVGMMDEKYFVYSDDADFVWRANKCGYRIMYWPQGNIYHKVSSSTGGGETPFSIYYSNRNRLYFMRKNFDSYYLLIPVLIFLLSRLVKGILYFDLKLANKLRKSVIDGFQM